MSDPTPDPTTTETDPVAAVERILFSSWLAGYGAGHLDNQLTVALTDVAQSVMLHGKGGTVTLKLSISESGNGVKVIGDVTSKAPEVKPGGQFFFMTPAGLSNRHPSQPPLPGM